MEQYTEFIHAEQFYHAINHVDPFYDAINPTRLKKKEKKKRKEKQIELRKPSQTKPNNNNSNKTETNKQHSIHLPRQTNKKPKKLKGIDKKSTIS